MLNCLNVGFIKYVYILIIAVVAAAEFLYDNENAIAAIAAFSKLLRSNSRDNFLSDEHYYNEHKQFYKTITDSKLTMAAAHPYIIILYSDCVQCHESLISVYSLEERYRIVDALKSIFHGTASEIEIMIKIFPHSIGNTKYTAVPFYTIILLYFTNLIVLHYYFMCIILSLFYFIFLCYFIKYTLNTQINIYFFSLRSHHQSILLSPHISTQNISFQCYQVQKLIYH